MSLLVAFTTSFPRMRSRGGIRGAVTHVDDERMGIGMDQLLLIAGLVAPLKPSTALDNTSGAYVQTSGCCIPPLTPVALQG
jgi:hypothetical protein